MFSKKTKTTESQDSHSNYPKDTIYSRQKCHILVTLRGECPRTTQAICCFLFLLSPLFTHLSNPPPLLSLLEYSACFIEWGFLTIHKEKGLRCLNQICCNFCAWMKQALLVFLHWYSSSWFLKFYWFLRFYSIGNIWHYWRTLWVFITVGDRYTCGLRK